ncbi:MAG: extracellular solute-binding protein [Lachnospiraceae bacterium]
MKKGISLLLCIGMVSSLLMGCGTDTSTTQEETLQEKKKSKTDETIELMTGTAVDTALYKEYEKMVEGFAKENPEALTIELIPSSTDHEGEVKTRLGGGNIPDMWMTHGWSLGRYSEYLLDLQEQEWAKDVSPLLTDIMFDKNGEIYALPLNIDIAGILYNQDVIEEAGFKVEDIKTWEDFNEVCIAVKANGKIPIYNAGKDRWPTGLYVDWIAPTFFTEEDNQNMLAGNFVADKYSDTLAVVEGFANSDFFNPDYSSATSDDVSRAIAQGDAAFSFIMNFALVTAYEYAPDGNLGFMPIPNANGKEPYTVCGEKDAIGIAKDGKNVETCVEFLNYLAKPENIAALATSSGQMAGLASASSELGALSKSLENAEKYPGVPYFDRVYMPSGSWDAIVATTEMIVTKQKTLEEAMTQIEKEYDSLIKK